MKKILSFPRIRQSFDFDCGTAVLQAILAYYGIDSRADKIIKLAKTCSQNGTRVVDLIDAINAYGLKAHAAKMSIEDIKAQIDKGRPVILSIQAWPTEEVECMKSNWEDGHYVAAIGYTDDKIIFEDPGIFKRTYLSHDELIKRWHDIDDDGNEYVNFGIAVHGKDAEFDPDEMVDLVELESEYIEECKKKASNFTKGLASILILL